MAAAIADNNSAYFGRGTATVFNSGKVRLGCNWLAPRKRAGMLSGLELGQHAENPGGVDYNEIAGVIERFVDGTAAPWEWEGYFLATKYQDSFLGHIQQRVLAVSFEFPPGPERGYTSAEGLEILRGLAAQLRSEARK